MPEVVDLEQDELPLVVERCAAILERGGLIILPTDTVYGLAARVEDKVAVEKIFNVKGREAEKALVVMVSSREEAMGLAVPQARQALSRLGSLWPGPLTLVVKAADMPWMDYVAPSSATLGIRVPASPLLLQLLRQTGPLAVTSANLTGGRAPGSFQEVDRELLDVVDMVIRGGQRGSGKPSTVAEICGDEVKILRRGKIEERDLHRALDEGRD